MYWGRDLLESNTKQRRSNTKPLHPSVVLNVSLSGLFILFRDLIDLDQDIANSLGCISHFLGQHTAAEGVLKPTVFVRPETQQQANRGYSNSIA